MTLPTITRAMADTYFATTTRNPQWIALSTSDRDMYLGEGQIWLKALCWDEKADCCGNNFDQQFTRAVSELALALHGNPTALIGTGVANTGTLGAIKRQKLGDLEVEYHAPTSATATASSGGGRGPLLLRTFPWLKEMIGCFLSNPYSSLLYRVRS